MEKKFYGLAKSDHKNFSEWFLQVKRKYDRLVHQKKQLIEIPQEFFPSWSKALRLPGNSKIGPR